MKNSMSNRITLPRMKRLCSLMVMLTLGQAYAFNPLTPALKEWHDKQLVAVQSLKGPTAWYFESEKYTSDGRYMDYAKVFRTNTFANPKNLNQCYDDLGVALTKIKDTCYYHPVGIAQHGLIYYSYLSRPRKPEELALLESDRAMVIKSADALLKTMNKDGNFEYPFDKVTHVANYKVGWHSGMAQGMGVSLLLRTYLLTKDAKYMDAANDAYRAMVRPVSKGGSMNDLSQLNPSWKNIWIEEYPTEPGNYTLNGYIFALVGLYDASNLSKDPVIRIQAKRYFDDSLRGLEKVVSMYDMGGFTSYDLSHLTYASQKLPHVLPSYHPVHVRQLHWLNTFVDSEVLRDVEKKWHGYVNFN